ncbi:hypothetical protein CR513_30233, partial [Mucuna pruriens]
MKAMLATPPIFTSLALGKSLLVYLSISDDVVNIAIVQEREEKWFLSIDEASNQKGSGGGTILEGPNGVLIEQSLQFEFKASNN